MLNDLTVLTFFKRFNYQPKKVTLMCTQYKKQISAEAEEEVDALIDKYWSLPVIDFLICNPGDNVIVSVEGL